MVSLASEVVPGNIWLRTLNLGVSNLQGNWLRVVAESTKMPSSLCGVSSFGFSGTNAHAILAASKSEPSQDAMHPWASQSVGPSPLQSIAPIAEVVPVPPVVPMGQNLEYVFSLKWETNLTDVGSETNRKYLVLSRWEDRDVLPANPGDVYIRACWNCPPGVANSAGIKEVDLNEAESFQELVIAEAHGAAGILLVCPRSQVDDHPKPDSEALFCCLHLLQALLKWRESRLPRVVVITCGAEFVEGLQETLNLSQAPVLGFVRAAAVEYPGQLYLMDVLPGERLDLSHFAWQRPRQALRLGSSRHQTLIQAQVAPDWASVEGKTFVVSGGFGSLGFEATRWLAKQGAQRLLVLSRSAQKHTQKLRDFCREFPATTVLAQKCDVAEQSEVNHALSLLQPSPVHGIVHSAGSAAKVGLLKDLERNAFGELQQSGVYGSWALHRASEAWHLEHFVLFSSSASVLPMAGQAPYAAQTAFLDQLADLRRLGGRVGSVINFGLWGRGWGRS